MLNTMTKLVIIIVVVALLACFVWTARDWDE